MYVLVLGLDVLGNPFGLIRGLSEGFEALFYEPYQVEKFYRLSSFSRRSSSYLYVSVKLCNSDNFVFSREPSRDLRSLLKEWQLG